MSQFKIEVHSCLDLHEDLDNFVEKIKVLSENEDFVEGAKIYKEKMLVKVKKKMNTDICMTFLYQKWSGSTMCFINKILWI